MIGAPETQDVSFAQRGSWGIITLTRERALNALTVGMVQHIYEQLLIWRNDVSIRAVMIEGAGDKAFCAGGDIVQLAATAQQDPNKAINFFYHEYRLTSLIHHYPKPYVAMVDGIVMGGGVGVSVHGQYQICGDKTVFAMPETGIGLFPDVGGGYFLPRLDDGLGFYYGLTGARAKGTECVAAGIFSHFVPTSAQRDLKEQLLSLDLDEAAHTKIEATLAAYMVFVEPDDLSVSRDEVKHFFSALEDLDMLFQRLNATNSSLSKDLLKTVSRLSPTSLSITFEQLSRGAALSFNDNMRMEYRIVSRVMAGSEFGEGVRALLVDKDKSPNWQPSDLASIQPSEIEAYFASFDPAEGAVDLVFDNEED